MMKTFTPSTLLTLLLLLLLLNTTFCAAKCYCDSGFEGKHAGRWTDHNPTMVDGIQTGKCGSDQICDSSAPNCCRKAPLPVREPSNASANQSIERSTIKSKPSAAANSRPKRASWELCYRNSFDDIPSIMSREQSDNICAQALEFQRKRRERPLGQKIIEGITSFFSKNCASVKVCTPPTSQSAGATPRSRSPVRSGSTTPVTTPVTSPPHSQSPPKQRMPVNIQTLVNVKETVPLMPNSFPPPGFGGYTHSTPVMQPSVTIAKNSQFPVSQTATHWPKPSANTLSVPTNRFMLHRSPSDSALDSPKRKQRM